MTRVEQIRKIQGLSQTRLGIKAEIHPSVISDLERQKRVAWPALREKLALALNVEQEQLFTENGWPIEAEAQALEG